MRDTLVIVRRGQTLSQVVMPHFMQSDYATAREMLDWARYHNRLTTDVLITGQPLRIPLGPLALDPEDATDDSVASAAAGGDALRGLYINVRRSGERGAVDLARRLLQAGGNAVVFDVKDRDGMLTYRSDADLAREAGACAAPAISDPGAFVRQLQELDLQVIARLVCFQDGRVAAARPDLAPRTDTGETWYPPNGHAWVDPALPQIQEYLFALIEEAAGLGVDELQLDYVRFPTDSDDDRVAFAFQSGPSRGDIITDFVRQAAEVAASQGVRLSADVFGVAAWAHVEDVLRTGQDVRRLLPHLDVVSPMLYPSHFSAGFGNIDSPSLQPFDLVYGGCSRLRSAAAGHAVTVRPWIQAFPWRVPTYAAPYVVEQLRAAMEGGASGWLLWNPANQYEAGLEAMRSFAGVPARVDIDSPDAEPASEPLGALLGTD